MLRLDCPFCGLRDHDEFSYLEDGSVTMPSFTDTSERAWFEAVFLRENLRGKHVELWHHVNGCRMVLRVERDTQTHAISKVEAAHLFGGIWRAQRPSLAANAKQRQRNDEGLGWKKGV